MSGFRIKVDLSGLPGAHHSTAWFFVEGSYAGDGDIGQLKAAIFARFKLPPEQLTEIELFLDDCVLPDCEPISMLKGNDTVALRPDITTVNPKEVPDETETATVSEGNSSVPQLSPRPIDLVTSGIPDISISVAVIEDAPEFSSVESTGMAVTVVAESVEESNGVGLLTEKELLEWARLAKIKGTNSNAVLLADDLDDQVEVDQQVIVDESGVHDPDPVEQQDIVDEPEVFNVGDESDEQTNTDQPKVVNNVDEPKRQGTADDPDGQSIAGEPKVQSILNVDGEELDDKADHDEERVDEEKLCARDEICSVQEEEQVGLQDVEGDEIGENENYEDFEPQGEYFVVSDVETVDDDDDDEQIDDVHNDVDSEKQQVGNVKTHDTVVEDEKAADEDIVDSLADIVHVVSCDKPRDDKEEEHQQAEEVNQNEEDKVPVVHQTVINKHDGEQKVEKEERQQDEDMDDNETFEDKFEQIQEAEVACELKAEALPTKKEEEEGVDDDEIEVLFIKKPPVQEELPEVSNTIEQILSADNDETSEATIIVKKEAATVVVGQTVTQNRNARRARARERQRELKRIEEEAERAGVPAPAGVVNIRNNKNPTAANKSQKRLQAAGSGNPITVLNSRGPPPGFSFDMPTHRPAPLSLFNVAPLMKAGLCGPAPAVGSTPRFPLFQRPAAGATMNVPLKLPLPLFHIHQQPPIREFIMPNYHFSQPTSPSIPLTRKNIDFSFKPQTKVSYPLFTLPGQRQSPMPTSVRTTFHHSEQRLWDYSSPIPAPTHLPRPVHVSIPLSRPAPVPISVAPPFQFPIPTSTSSHANIPSTLDASDSDKGFWLSSDMIEVRKEVPPPQPFKQSFGYTPEGWCRRSPPSVADDATVPLVSSINSRGGTTMQMIPTYAMTSEGNAGQSSKSANNKASASTAAQQDTRRRKSRSPRRRSPSSSRRRSSPSRLRRSVRSPITNTGRHIRRKSSASPVSRRRRSPVPSRSQVSPSTRRLARRASSRSSSPAGRGRSSRRSRSRTPPAARRGHKRGRNSRSRSPNGSKMSHGSSESRSRNRHRRRMRTTRSRSHSRSPSRSRRKLIDKTSPLKSFSRSPAEKRRSASPWSRVITLGSRRSVSMDRDRGDYHLSSLVHPLDSVSSQSSLELRYQNDDGRRVSDYSGYLEAMSSGGYRRRSRLDSISSRSTLNLDVRSPLDSISSMSNSGLRGDSTYNRRNTGQSSPLLPEDSVYYDDVDHHGDWNEYDYGYYEEMRGDDDYNDDHRYVMDDQGDDRYPDDEGVERYPDDEAVERYPDEALGTRYLDEGDNEYAMLEHQDEEIREGIDEDRYITHEHEPLDNYGNLMTIDSMDSDVLYEGSFEHSQHLESMRRNRGSTSHSWVGGNTHQDQDRTSSSSLKQWFDFDSERTRRVRGRSSETTSKNLKETNSKRTSEADSKKSHSGTSRRSAIPSSITESNKSRPRTTTTTSAERKASSATAAAAKKILAKTNALVSLKKSVGSIKRPQVQSGTGSAKRASTANSSLTNARKETTKSPLKSILKQSNVDKGMPTATIDTPTAKKIIQDKLVETKSKTAHRTASSISVTNVGSESNDGQNKKISSRANEAAQTRDRMMGKPAPNSIKSTDFYSNFPILVAPPHVNDIIAYKMFDLDENGSPEDDIFKVGKVIQFDSSHQEVLLESRQTGNHEGYSEDLIEEVAMDWTCFSEVRLISRINQ